MKAANELKNSQWLADKLGVSISTLEKWRSGRNISLPPCIKLGGAIRYDEQVVEAWLKGQMQRSNEERSAHSDTPTHNNIETGAAK